MEVLNMTKTDKNGQLTQSQHICINSLLSGNKVIDACKDAKVTRQAYYVWLKDDQAFQEELERRRNEVVESSMEKIRSLMDMAVNKLETLLQSENEEIARKSANSIIEYSLKWSENDDIEERLEEVERLYMEKRTYRD
jgi:hypothetical protein